MMQLFLLLFMMLLLLLLPSYEAEVSYQTVLFLLFSGFELGFSPRGWVGGNKGDKGCFRITFSLHVCFCCLCGQCFNFLVCYCGLDQNLHFYCFLIYFVYCVAFVLGFYVTHITQTYLQERPTHIPGLKTYLNFPRHSLYTNQSKHSSITHNEYARNLYEHHQLNASDH